MELGEKLKKERLAAGLTQRQLCGDTITRNMLSQIENGTAKPSMDTLRILAGRLGKTVSFFLEEEVAVSPNQDIMRRARDAFFAGDCRRSRRILEEYREPDGIFDAEYRLLNRLNLLYLAERAVEEKRNAYAKECLDAMEELPDGYGAQIIDRQRQLLRLQLQPTGAKEPDYDRELMILAEAALAREDFARSGHLLDGMATRISPEWNYLRGRVYEAQKQYEAAADCYIRAEENMPERVCARLEICFRELGDYRRAYEYACRQRGG